MHLIHSLKVKVQHPLKSVKDRDKDALLEKLISFQNLERRNGSDRTDGVGGDSPPLKENSMHVDQNLKEKLAVLVFLLQKVRFPRNTFELNNCPYLLTLPSTLHSSPRGNLSKFL